MASQRFADDDRVLMCLEHSVDVVTSSVLRESDDEDYDDDEDECDDRTQQFRVAVNVDDVTFDYERSGCRRALNCPTLLSDCRVLDNLLRVEQHCLPLSDYFTSVQTDVEPYMRDTVTSWMLEVLVEQCCEEDVFSLAVNYFDRVLSRIRIPKSQLQLVGTVCMFIAAKFKDTIAIPADRLVMYTDFSVTADQIFEWELLILQVLQWNLSAVTPHDYIEQLLSRLPAELRHGDRMKSIKRHAQTFIAMCTADVTFSACLPSVMAAASVSGAANGLLGHVTCDEVKLLHHLHRLIRTDTVAIKACQDRIEKLLNNRVQGRANQQSTVVAPAATVQATPSKSGDVSVNCPSTPTDVRDIRVCH